jgi:hypothetical protein
MSRRLKLATLLALATAALLALVPAAGAKPIRLDHYCSSSGDICQDITLSRKSGNVKFTLISFTAAVYGPYTLCVKGPHGKECKDFVLEQLPAGEAWEDRVVWQKEYPTDAGQYVVKWKYMGDRLGKKLRFEVGGPVEGAR